MQNEDLTIAPVGHNFDSHIKNCHCNTCTGQPRAEVCEYCHNVIVDYGHGYQSYWGGNGCWAGEHKPERY